MNISDNLLGVHDAEEHHIVDALLDKVHSDPMNRYRHRVAKPVLDDADIMGREVPESVDIGPDAT
jgi:hypothetical protein